MMVTDSWLSLMMIMGEDSLALRWRHNEWDGVSNHQPHDCLVNCLSGRRSKKTSKPRVTGLCAGISPGPVDSPHKWPVTRKLFPFDDVIMVYDSLITVWWLADDDNDSCCDIYDWLMLDWCRRWLIDDLDRWSRLIMDGEDQLMITMTEDWLNRYAIDQWWLLVMYDDVLWVLFVDRDNW